MGPHPERCGYVRPDARVQEAAALQWGHTPKGVDTSCGPARCGRRRSSLQWGHTPKGVDTPPVAGDLGHRGVASMGPHPERCGYTAPAGEGAPGGRFNGATPRKVWIQGGEHDGEGLPGASMGPHPERCGYQALGAEQTMQQGRFNGATPRKVWIRPGAQRAGRKPYRFNGATPRKVWIPGPSPRRRTSGSRFNGATPRKVWIRLVVGPVVGPVGLASMGPHPERCGYLAEPRQATPHLALQWGHTPKGVDTAHCTDPRPACGTLQWGHTPKGVDTAGRGQARSGKEHGFNGATPRKVWILVGSELLRCAEGASMGPHPERCGYPACRWPGRRRRSGLQWGHTPKGVDTGTSRKTAPTSSGLQWGHTPKGVDTRVTRRPSRGAARGFNGATPRKVWIPHLLPDQRLQPVASMGPHPERCGYSGCRRGSRWRSSSFNGATPRKVWIPSTPHLASYPSAALQWGHTPKGVDTRGAFAGIRLHGRFNGATPRKVWIHCGLLGQGKPMYGFNGATPRKVWILEIPHFSSS